MELDDLPEIADQWFDHNYIVSQSDLEATLLFKEGYPIASDEKLLKAVLYVYGMDVNRGYQKIELAEGQGHRSEITGLLQEGGAVYSGYQRQDDVWKKNGIENCINYLFSKNKVLLKTLGLVKE